MMGRKRSTRRFYKSRHGEDWKQAMNAPATPKQVDRLVSLGMSKRAARKMTRGEASLEISKRLGR